MTPRVPSPSLASRIVCCIVCCILFGACGSSADSESGSGDTDQPGAVTEAIRVGSFDFAESVLVAELYAQALEAEGFRVERQEAIGPREVVAPALEAGLLDVVPEYLGTARGHFAPDPADDASVAAELRRRGLTLLAPAPAQDVNVFVVTVELAAEYGLRSIGDVAVLPSGRRLGGPVECPDRPLCLLGLEQTYGLSFVEFVPLRSLDVTAEALRRDEIDVGVMFSTAAQLDPSEFVALDDDLGLQPAENVIPLVRTAALAAWGPALEQTLNRLSGRLTTGTLQALNRQVDNGLATEAVAAAWLERVALVPD